MKLEVESLVSLSSFPVSETNLNVMVNRNNNKFISGWRLSPDQITNMKNNGNIQ